MLTIHRMGPLPYCGLWSLGMKCFRTTGLKQVYETDSVWVFVCSILIWAQTEESYRQNCTKICFKRLERNKGAIYSLKQSQEWEQTYLQLLIIHPLHFLPLLHNDLCTRARMLTSCCGHLKQVLLVDDGVGDVHVLVVGALDRLGGLQCGQLLEAHPPNSSEGNLIICNTFLSIIPDKLDPDRSGILGFCNWKKCFVPSDNGTQFNGLVFNLEKVIHLDDEGKQDVILQF